MSSHRCVLTSPPDCKSSTTRSLIARPGGLRDYQTVDLTHLLSVFVASVGVDSWVDALCKLESIGQMPNLR